jgi:hypothetical protein
MSTPLTAFGKQFRDLASSWLNFAGSSRIWLVSWLSRAI